MKYIDKARCLNTSSGVLISFNSNQDLKSSIRRPMQPLIAIIQGRAKQSCKPELVLVSENYHTTTPGEIISHFYLRQSSRVQN